MWNGKEKDFGLTWPDKGKGMRTFASLTASYTARVKSGARVALKRGRFRDAAVFSRPLSAAPGNHSFARAALGAACTYCLSLSRAMY
jgi:hypothetical protein